MWFNYDCRVKYVREFDWYEVELNDITFYVRGELDESDAFALAAMCYSNFDLEAIFEDSITIDYTNHVLSYAD